jgi:bacteriocin-like protein
MILGLHNNGFTGIDQPNTYSRRLKMTKQKQMTEKELDQVSGGILGQANGMLPKQGKRMSRKGVNSVLGQANGFHAILGQANG